MHDDGTIDYSGYTLRELKEALDGIDAAKYPENHRALMAELAKRPVPAAPVAAPASSAQQEREDFYGKKPVSTEGLFATLLGGLALVALGTYKMLSHGQWAFGSRGGRDLMTGTEGWVFLCTLALGACSVGVRLYSRLRYGKPNNPLELRAMDVGKGVIFAFIGYAILSIFGVFR